MKNLYNRYHEEKWTEVEFKRISLTGFRSCTSRSRYRSVSKQTTRITELFAIDVQVRLGDKLSHNQGEQPNSEASTLRAVVNDRPFWIPLLRQDYILSRTLLLVFLYEMPHISGTAMMFVIDVWTWVAGYLWLDFESPVDWNRLLLLEDTYRKVLIYTVDVISHSNTNLHLLYTSNTKTRINGSPGDMNRSFKPPMRSSRVA
ncbi:hypothetical protein Tco_0682375 [Tanacetum coccineum]|uniref:Uncharacterized protein n=1 Tax=Tanacetum coccineum TaxID=301880 RepID=A0ABQ4XSK1_9ASTR